MNLYYGRSGLPPFFSHGITFMSGPDLVEPAFHFCVGFALRLVVLKRLGAAAGDGCPAWGGAFWRPRAALFFKLLRTRVVGLIVLSMFFTEGWGQFDTWAQIQGLGFGGWLLALVQNVQPYHTLLHIAFITVWTFVPMTLGPVWRVGQFVITSALHILLLSTFYFRWIKDFGLDEGGYFGFVGWSATALAGSLAHDVVVWARTAPAPPAKGAAGGLARPLLRALNEGEDGEGDARPAAPPRPQRALPILFAASAGLMLLAYLLSCLGTVRAANPICYDGTRIYFWGGFGAVKDCALVPTVGGSSWAVAPPFYVPDPDANVVTQWTMTQRAGSMTYHLFTAGTSTLLFALFFALCEVGVPAPAAPPLAAAARAAGFAPGAEGALVLRWRAADVFGENSLAVYLLSDPLANTISDMLPDDVPAWYFLLWGEGLYFIVAYAATLYLRNHKLFLRL